MSGVQVLQGALESELVSKESGVVGACLTSMSVKLRDISLSPPLQLPAKLVQRRGN